MGLCHLLNDKRLWLDETTWSEFFRAQHSGDEVEEAEDGDQADDDVFHG
jgi:hypothetical protein